MPLAHAPKLSSHFRLATPTGNHMDFQDRILRLQEVSSGLHLSEDFPMLKGFRLSPSQKSAVETATAYFLYESLRHHNPDFYDSLDGGFFERNATALSALPNVTPNGLVLPKEPNFLAYNILHKTISTIFESWRMDRWVHSVHVPINVRLVAGNSGSAVHARPRATTKPHSDIWAAEPANCVMIFFAVFGDYVRTGIEFFEPRSFPKDLMRPLDDFREGEALMEGAVQYHLSYPLGTVLFTDPFLLHRTMRNNGGPRLSLDFRFLLKEKVASDVYTDSPRLSNYVPPGTWYEYGMRRLLTSHDALDFVPAPDQISNRNAARFSTVDI
jgi:hypothetical protein